MQGTPTEFLSISIYINIIRCNKRKIIDIELRKLKIPKLIFGF